MYTSRKDLVITMAYATTKKQNRILLIALVVLLAAAAILIAVTGSANKSKPTTPPIDTTETGGPLETDAPSPSEDAFGNLFPKDDETEAPKETAAPAETAKKDEKPTSAETGDSTEVSAVVTDKIPQFSRAVNGVVSKDFSMEVPVFSYTMNDYRTHTGVDILCEAGTSVVAPADGIVGQVWEDPMMGICINLIHSGGAVTTFKGLAPETMDFIAAGTQVKKGQAIAASGQTALVECGDDPHVHMELAVNGELVNPGDYFPLEYLSDTYED